MKFNKLFALLTGVLISAGASAQLAPPLLATPNTVYLEQIGNSNDTDITQIGVGNVIRGFANMYANALVKGNTNVLHLEQIGDNNLSQFEIYGSTNGFTSRMTGNGNMMKLKIGTSTAPASNNFISETVTGTANEVDQTINASSVNSTVILAGNQNEVLTTLSSTNGKNRIETLAGSLNNGIEVEQLDSAGANGHDSDVTIQGAANSVLIQQQGTNDTLIKLTITGDLNLVTIRSSSTSLLNSRTAVPR